MWLQEAENTYIRALRVDPYYIATSFNYGNLLMNHVGHERVSLSENSLANFC